MILAAMDGQMGPNERDRINGAKRTGPNEQGRTKMHKNYIAGEWLAADNAIENRNPSDITDLIGTYAQAETDHLERALDSARAAQKQWQATGLEARQTALMNIGNALMARADELGELLSREEGKPRA